LLSCLRHIDLDKFDHIIDIEIVRLICFKQGVIHCSWS